MTRAIYKDGVFHPLDPVPVEWTEGTEVDVERSKFEEDETEDWSAEVARAAAEISDEDESRLSSEIKRIRDDSCVLAANGKL